MTKYIAFLLSLTFPFLALAVTRFADDTAIPDWALESVYTMKENKIMTGFGDNSFQPDTTINRAQALVILQRALPLTQDISLDTNMAQTRFVDVPQDAWFASAVNAATNAGWITGYPDGTFRPEQLVNKAEWAVLLRRAYAMTHDEETRNLPGDVPADAWYTDAAASMVQYGLLRQSYADFKAEAPVTRAEAAWMMHRVLDRPEFQQWYIDQQEVRQAALRTRQLTAVRRSDFNANLQGTPYEKKGLQTNVYLDETEPLVITLGDDWQFVGSIRLENDLEDIMELESMHMRLLFADTSRTDPARQFQTKLALRTTKKTLSPPVRQVDVSRTGQVYYTGLGMMVSPGQDEWIDIYLRPNPAETQFVSGGEAQLSIADAEATMYRTGGDRVHASVVIQERVFRPLDFRIEGALDNSDEETTVPNDGS